MLLLLVAIAVCNFLMFFNRATNSVIVLPAFFHCVIVAIFFLFLVGARESVRITRRSEHDDLMNSAIGGLFSGALLGRLQGSLS